MTARWALAALLCAACAGSAPPPLSAPITAQAESWRAQIPAPGARSQLEYPAPVTRALENGLKIWVVRRPARTISVSLVIRHGASSVPRGKSGLAALTARLMTESTEARNPLELAEAVESLGTNLQHDAGRDYSSIRLGVLSSDLEPALDLIAEVTRRPRFAADELERVRSEWLDGLIAERQSPQRLASLAALRLLLGEPHGAPVSGAVSDVRNLTIGELVGFHRRAWQPRYATLVLVGDVDPDRARESAERALGSWKNGSVSEELEPPPLEAAPPSERPRVVLIDRPDSVQSALFAAQRFPRRDAPGFEARQILNGVVGGLFTSRLNQNLREKNAYTYGVRSQAIATRDWGAFVVNTSIETQVTAPALGEILSELAATKDAALGRPITDEEMARASAALVSGLGAHLEHVDRVADDMTSLIGLGVEPDYFSRFASIVTSTTRAGVLQQARSMLAPEQLVVVIVGDAAKLEPELTKLSLKVERAAPVLYD
jgi:zinc protease